MPPARLLATAREPHLTLVPNVRNKDTYDAGQPLSGIAGSRLFSAFAPMFSSTGEPVTPFTALTAAPVYACIRCLAEDLAKLPFELQERSAGGGWEDGGAHPMASLFQRPNRWQTPFEFWAFLVSCLQLRGNSFHFIVRDRAGQPQALIPIHPDRCWMNLSPEGWLFYDISHPAFRSGEQIRVHQDDMLHIKNAISVDGFTGLSPIAIEQEAIGLALATQKHGGTLFRQGTQASGVLKHPANLSDPAQDRIRASWQDRYTGVDNAHKVLILEEGMTFEKLSMTSDEAQFLATRDFQVNEICRIYRVPPHKIANLDRSTFSNIENQNQQYIDDSLVPMARKIEQASDHHLLFDDERARWRFRFDFDSLLRGDMKSRYEAYHVALGDGWLNRNQVRSRENLPRFEGGDEYRVALNTEAVKPAGSTAPQPGDAAPAAPAALS